jgi:hypothetical protein
MTLSYRHIGLLTGIASVFVSFLFFARKQDAYNILLLGGLATALIFYLTILFSREQRKAKLIWTAIVFLCAAIQQLVEPILINNSYRIYIHHNKGTLAEINSILMHRKGDITVFSDHVIAEGDSLSEEERSKLLDGREKLGVYQIFKFDQGVYYGMWGFLDVRLGITYLPNSSEAGSQYQHVTGNWFH